MKWEFDSILEHPYKDVLFQVWIRPSNLFKNEINYTITPNIDGAENPPNKENCGHWTHKEAFLISFPNYKR